MIFDPMYFVFLIPALLQCSVRFSKQSDSQASEPDTPVLTAHRPEPGGDARNSQPVAAYAHVFRHDDHLDRMVSAISAPPTTPPTSTGKPQRTLTWVESSWLEIVSPFESRRISEPGAW